MLLETYERTSLDNQISECLFSSGPGEGVGSETPWMSKKVQRWYHGKWPFISVGCVYTEFFRFKSVSIGNVYMHPSIIFLNVIK